MKDKEDNELVRLAKEEQSNEAFNELIERHSGIFVDTVSKFCPQHRRNFWLQELLEEKHSVFWNAVDSFKGEKSKFHTWLANITRYKCQTERTRQAKRQDEIFIGDVSDNLINQTPDSFDFDREIEKIDLNDIISKVLPNKFSERDCDIFYQRFEEGKKLNEISTQFGIQPARVHQIQNKILEEIKKEIQ